MTDIHMTYDEAIEVRDKLVALLDAAQLNPMHGRINLAGATASWSVYRGKTDSYGVRVAANPTVGRSTKRLFRSAKAAYAHITKTVVIPTKERSAARTETMLSGEYRVFLIGWWAYRHGYKLQLQGTASPAVLTKHKRANGVTLYLTDLHYDADRDMLVTYITVASWRGKIDVPNVDVLLASGALT